MTPLDGTTSTPRSDSNPSSTAGTTVTGQVLNFRVDIGASLLELSLDDGSSTDLWEGTLSYGFDPQQSTVKLHFASVDATYAIEATRLGPDGTTVTVGHDGNAALDMLANPNQTGATYIYDLTQVAPRSTAAGTDSSGLRLLKTRLVFTTTQSDSDPDALPIIVVPKG